jgi:hypothetical protein
MGAAAVWSGESRAERGTVRAGEMVLPVAPDFKTRHLIHVIYGGGARKKDVVDNPELAPYQNELIPEGTLFTEDYGDTASLHGYMYTEMFTGIDPPTQRPLFPTFNEYVREKTSGKASDFWVLQGVSYYRGWTFDVKHFSRHADYGIAFGATSLTMNKLFCEENAASPRELVDRFLEKGLGHTARERKDIEEWIADVRARRSYVPPSTREPLIDRELQYGDAQALHMVPQILKAFKPKIVTVQVLALDDAHSDFGYWDHHTDYGEYVKHLKATDELIGKMWAEVQADPYFRDTTALILRPECGRDDEVNVYGQLGHSPGNHDAHIVWSMALGPDFRKNHVVTEKVQRRDLAPTITYLMSGQSAEHAIGHVRTQMFKDEHRLPPYVLPFTAELNPGIDWEGEREARRRAETAGRFARGTGD